MSSMKELYTALQEMGIDPEKVLVIDTPVFSTILSEPCLTPVVE